MVNVVVKLGHGSLMQLSGGFGCMVEGVEGVTRVSCFLVVIGIP